MPVEAGERGAVNPYQAAVAEFNFVVDTPRGSEPAPRAIMLRARLVIEEALEFVKACGYKVARAGDYQDQVKRWHAGVAPGVALHEYLGVSYQEYSDMLEGKLVLLKIGEPNFPEMVDALMDDLYVNFGACDAFGIDADPFFAEVHNTNMRKLDGPTDEFGKRLKPPGWQPPRIAAMLDSIAGVDIAQQARVIFDRFARD